MAIETILVTQLVTRHGAKTLEHVLIGAAPGVVDAHRIIGRDRAVDKAPLGFPLVFQAEFVEDALLIPKFENGVLALHKRRIADSFKHEPCSLDQTS